MALIPLIASCPASKQPLGGMSIASLEMETVR
jgi:hypothetical protein